MAMKNKAKTIIVMSSPSGGGKSTIAKHLMKLSPELRFSVSATTRKMRPGEVHGKDYYFLTRNEFQERIDEGGLIEYEEIFGNYYGTLKHIVQSSIIKGEKTLYDVDVKGARSLKDAFPDDTLTIFIKPPNRETLEKRLRKRDTETEESLTKRLARVDEEMAYEREFDIVIVNDKLEVAFAEIEKVAQEYGICSLK
ncbi:MAG: guanylate kinase [Candidatus Kapaibacteriales bacterium]